MEYLPKDTKNKLRTPDLIDWFTAQSTSALLSQII